MIFTEAMLHGSHHLSCELKGPLPTGPRYLTGSALHPCRRSLAVLAHGVPWREGIWIV